MVLCTQIKGKQPDRQKQQITTKTKLPFKIIRKEQENQKKADDEPTHRQEVKNIMKIRTANELKELNAALNNCTDTVWLMGPNDECYNMKNEEEYIEGIIRLAEDHDDQLGIFTSSREDEAIMYNYFKKMAA